MGRPKHKRAMIGGALDGGDVFLGKKVGYTRAAELITKRLLCALFSLRDGMGYFSVIGRTQRGMECWRFSMYLAYRLHCVFRMGTTSDSCRIVLGIPSTSAE